MAGPRPVQLFLVLIIALAGGLRPSGGAETSLRFHGNGENGIDRVKIKINDPARPADIGKTDFTLEFWMKADASDNTGTVAAANSGDGWITGNTIIDRDIFGNGDFGDFGVSIGAYTGGQPQTRVVSFGVDRLGTGTTIIGTTNVADKQWHHIAVTRRFSDGQMRIFVDGKLDAQGTGPPGNISYRNARSTDHPDSDPYLVIGAEKHDAGAAFPSFNGWVDEVRLSGILRYASSFTRPKFPFKKDSNAKALYHFSEGSGDAILDSSGASGGPSNGARNFGGSPPGPEWSTDIPFWPVLQFTELASGLANPVHINHAGDGSGRLFIVERAGRIKIYREGAGILETPFLDISSIAGSGGGEQGLLCVAFPPDYAAKGHFYVNYTNLDGDTVIARYKVAQGNADQADPNSAQILLTIDQPFSNHNGGQMAFGPDGYLYIGTGDGGSAGDPQNNAQKKGSLLGKILRIDVEAGANPYRIPVSNPYVNKPGRDEIWARGLRNPWRFSFDGATGALYIADVGQNAREEINFQPVSGSGGRNYGWRILEGSLCFNPASGCTPPADYAGPVAQYDHATGGCSVTGGFVYRGMKQLRMQGIYFYGDFCSGRIWGLKRKSGKWKNKLLADTAFMITTFGVDEDAELYLADYPTGNIYKVEDEK